MLNVFVSIGKKMPKDKSIVEDAESVAKILAKYGCTMVQSGAKLGLMGVVVQEFEKYSNEMVMITPEQFKTDLDKHICKQNFVVELESDRMKTAVKNFDLAVILPGGMGTFAELAYFNEVCKSGESDAKLVILNSKGYYNSLLKFFKHQAKLGFTDNDSVKFQVAKNVASFEHILQNLIAEKHNQIYQEELQNAKTVKQAEDKAEQDVEAKVTSVAKKSTKKSTKKPVKKTAKKSAKKSVGEENTENSTVKSVKADTKSTTKAKVEKVSKKAGRPAKKVEAIKAEIVKPEEVKAVEQFVETVKDNSTKKASKTKTSGIKKTATKKDAKAESVKSAKKTSAKSGTKKTSSKAKSTSKTTKKATK